VDQVDARAPSVRIGIALASIAIALVAVLLVARHDSAPGHGGSSSVLAQAADSPDVLGVVAPFAFQERGGAIVRREDLAGEPWVASSIFTRCTGPCPAVTSTMNKLQARLDGSRAKLVTFTVDPEYDTPEKLAEYARAAGANPKRWLFVTGPTADIDAFIRQSFSSPVERSTSVPVGEHVSHSTRLVVVDKQGRVRGMYSGETDADLDAIVARVRFLERETAPSR
jgi:cytochrome oxidase Cu insertion factor (SCO1/SenC/PrrC family)